MKKIKNLFWVFLAVPMLACVHQTEVGYQAIVTQDKALAEKHGYFHSIQAALDAAPVRAGMPYRIFIEQGDYYEKLIIDKPDIHFIGAGMNKTRIHFDAYAGQVSEPGKTWGTRGSGTIIVRAEGVQLHRLTVENTFDFVNNDALENGDPQKVRDSQAVALHLDAGSDRVLVREVKLLGFQDTLFVDAGRAWFDHSVIAGNVDFIFGAGNALFTDSEIITRIRGRENFPHAYVTAPSTQIADEFGLTFIRCRLTREPGVPDNSTPLGRPWHPTRNFPDGRYADPDAIGKAVFIDTEMDAHITQDGWYWMGGTTRDGGKEPFMPEDARFFEYQSRGAGAHVNSKRRQLTDVEVQRYTWESMMGDWKVF
ncbi:MAG: pectinesterase family protein [Cellvibrio sp.]